MDFICSTLRYKTNEEKLEYLEKITGKSINKSVTVSLPFQTDFGKHISFFL